MSIPEAKISARFIPGVGSNPLPELCRELLRTQRVHWPMCREGYAALEDVRTRRVECSGFSVHLQFNPRRIVSTAAKVDAASIKERACFLCMDRLPTEQRGVSYGNKYLILCNPAPIFREHFTIVHCDHRPQEILPELPVMFSLARDMAPEYTVFYNGPRCGASAPDHLHLQAVPRNAIPADFEALEAIRHVRLREIGTTTIDSLRSYGRSVVVLRSQDESDLAGCFRRLVEAWQRHTSETTEPMMNVLCSSRPDGTALTVFLRRKHRPDVYFAEGFAKVVISPAAVDIGGWIVTPVEKDFRASNTSLIEGIFAEVSMTDQDVKDIVSEL